MVVQFEAIADGMRLKFRTLMSEDRSFFLTILVGRRNKAINVVSILENLTRIYPEPEHPIRERTGNVFGIFERQVPG